MYLIYIFSSVKIGKKVDVHFFENVAFETRVKHNSKARENIRNSSYGFYSKMVEKEFQIDSELGR